VKALVKKESKYLIDAVQDVLNDGVDIQTFSSDRGTEYTGEPLQKFLRDKDILFRPKVGPSKAFAAEEKIYVLKKKLFHMLRASGRADWENYIDIVARNVNNLPISRTNDLTPNEITDSTEYQLREKRKSVDFLDWHKQIDNKRNFFTNYDSQPIHLGDYVYLYGHPEPLEKSHDYQLGRLYLVAGIKAELSPKMYVLHGLLGEIIPASWYDWEIRKSPEKPTDKTYWTISEQDDYAHQTIKGVKYLYVSFLHYPPQYNMWLPESQVVSASKVNHLQRKRK
jgi:hypothetical protein